MVEIHNQMRAKSVNLYDKEEELSKICNALSDPTRRKIIKMIAELGPLTINDIAWKINVPVSTTSYHVKSLIDADILIYASNSKRRGHEKHVALGAYLVNFTLPYNLMDSPNKVYSIDVPIGSYSSFHVEPTCGILTENGLESLSDTPVAFYSPNRFKAGLIWLHKGYLEYSIPLTDYIGTEGNDLEYRNKDAISSLSFKFELCSETPLYNHNYKSDITFSVNGLEICTFTTTGDFGEHRGRLNPVWLVNENTQYGLLYSIDIRFDGSYLNEKRVSDIAIDDLELPENNVLVFRLEVKNDATHIGGFNLFGKNFGDYPQDISLDITYLAARIKKK